MPEIAGFCPDFSSIRIMGGMRNVRVLRETVIRLDEVPKRIEGAACAETLRRWANRGIQVKTGLHTGKVITLEFANSGGTPMTSIEAYFRFQAAVNGQENALTKALFGETNEEH